MAAGTARREKRKGERGDEELKLNGGDAESEEHDEYQNENENEMKWR